MLYKAGILRVRAGRVPVDQEFFGRNDAVTRLTVFVADANYEIVRDFWRSRLACLRVNDAFATNTVSRVTASFLPKNS